MLIGELGEEALLTQLRSLFAVTSTGVPVGVGDDAAVIDIPPGRQMVWSTDILVEGIHFLTPWQTARQLGRKCLAVNLSDIVAMGAVPGYALLTLALPPDTRVDFVLELCQGLCDLAVEEGIAVIGGDSSSSIEGMIISVTVGGLVPADEAVLRSGAAPEDAILVTGYLGSAAGGLKLLEQEAAPEVYPELIASFREPRCLSPVAQAAVAAGVTAMTDISDGLSTDLSHLCQESGVGARIYRSRLPVHPQMSTAAESLGWDLESMVLGGGEDYGLLFTFPVASAEDAARHIAQSSGVKVTVIGEITTGRDITIINLDGKILPLAAQGYDHFVHRGQPG